jgi:hypothetical protein
VLVEPQAHSTPVARDNMARIVEAVAADRVLETCCSSIRERDTHQAPGRRSVLRHQHRLLARNEAGSVRIFNAVERAATTFVRLLESGSQEVIDALRRPGCAARRLGFPTWRKWKMLAEQPAERRKFLVCNADEVTLAPTWTAACSRATRTRFWRAC